MIRNYNAPYKQFGSLQAFWGEGFRVLGALVGMFLSFVVGFFNPYVINKAGPDWLWGGGRDDLIRSLYFKPNGSFRRYGRAALILTLIAGSSACYWMLQRLT